VLTAVAQVRDLGFRNQLPDLRWRQLPAQLTLHDLGSFLFRYAWQRLAGMEP
jgi:hypothetical protein